MKLTRTTSRLIVTVELGNDYHVELAQYGRHSFPETGSYTPDEAEQLAEALLRTAAEARATKGIDDKAAGADPDPAAAIAPDLDGWAK